MTQPQERHGRCRWLDNDRVMGERVLSINGQQYNVERVVANGLQYYRLHRLDPHTFDVRTYAVIPGPKGWSCSCPDAMGGNQGSCKHCRALQAALAARPY